MITVQQSIQTERLSIYYHSLENQTSENRGLVLETIDSPCASAQKLLHAVLGVSIASPACRSIDISATDLEGGCLVLETIGLSTDHAGTD